MEREFFIGMRLCSFNCHWMCDGNCVCVCLVSYMTLCICMHLSYRFRSAKSVGVLSFSLYLLCIVYT